VFNKVSRVVICLAHHKSIVVPSTGTTPDEVVMGLQDHIRRNHMEKHQDNVFYQRLLISLDSSLISAESLMVTLIRERNGICPVGGIPYSEGQVCNLCSFSGLKKALQSHFTNYHRGMPVTPNTTSAYVQNFQVNGTYLSVKPKPDVNLVNKAWQSLFNTFTEDIGVQSATNLETESAFVSHSGWVESVAGNETHCYSMAAAPQEDQMWPIILADVNKYLMLSNLEINGVNITLRRWLETRGYFSLVSIG
jgi:hypothetical protein